MRYIEPSDLLNEIYDEEFGFRLANFAIKPVHVANGLARSLAGRTYDTKPLVKTLRRYVRNQKLGVDEERNPNDAILNQYGVAFEPLSARERDLDRLTRLRSLAFDVLGADGAVFDQPDKSSFTLSNERFVTKDPSDHRAGRFLERLLTAEPKDLTEAADHIREQLQDEGDAWTTIALPLLDLGEPREDSGGEEAVELAAKAEHLFASKDGKLTSPTLRTLRDAYDRLARFEKMTGSKLNSLRRLMLFGCFAIHIHAITRWSERESCAPRPPILLDFCNGTVTSVRDASRATLRAAGDAIEGLIRLRFRAHVEAEWGSTAKEIEAVFDEAFSVASQQTEKKAEKAQKMWTRVRSTYQIYVDGGTNPVLSLTRALVEVSFEEGREHPVGALIELGRRAGFLTPWANVGRGGKLQKRYAATAEFLEILIAATVAPDEPLEFPEFLDRLRRDFGIVVGRPEGDDIIRRNNLYDEQFGPTTAINEEDLRRNVEAMRELVCESGYAKAYADGRTIVTTQPPVTL